jgi:hypothetical protein
MSVVIIIVVVLRNFNVLWRKEFDFFYEVMVMNLLIAVHKCHMYGFMCGIENGCSVNLSRSFVLLWLLL